jgi:Protein of unknown function (DUF1194)
MRHIGLPLLALLWAADACAGETEADLELVLAVDASGSVDDGEFQLQLEGIAAGFRDPAVQAAIRAGRKGRIAVEVLVWAEPDVPKDVTGWFILAGDNDADAFADLVARLPRHQNGATGMGEGVAAAVRSFLGNGISAPRQAIDVSGDGEETTPREMVVTMPQARGMAALSGVTINGLAILQDDPNLAEWYRNHVLTGETSFLLTAIGYGDFAEAMRRKLLREIEDRPKLSRL